MKQYNIYVILNRGSGEVSYQCTTLAKSYDEAEQETYEAACDKCESIARLYGLYDAEDCIDKYCSGNNLECNELDEEDLAIIDETYVKELESWIDYKAVLTKEDNIEEDDLTLIYIIENGSFSKIDRK